MVTQVEVALYSANTLLSKVSLIGEEPTLKEKVALMLQPAYILKGKTLPYPPPPPFSNHLMLSPPHPMTRHLKACNSVGLVAEMPCFSRQWGLKCPVRLEQKALEQVPLAK